MNLETVLAMAAAAGVTLSNARAEAALPLVLAMQRADAQLRALELTEPPSGPDPVP